MRAAVRDRYGPPGSSGSLWWTGRPSGPRGAGPGARGHGEPHRLWPTGGQAVDLPAGPSTGCCWGSGDRGGRSWAPRSPVRSRRSATGSRPSRSATRGFGFSGTTLGAPRRVPGRARGRVDGGHPGGPDLRGGGARQRGLALGPLIDPGGQGPARPGRRPAPTTRKPLRCFNSKHSRAGLSSWDRRADLAWSTFGPHAIGTQRSLTVSSGASWCSRRWDPADTRPGQNPDKTPMAGGRHEG